MHAAFDIQKDVSLSKMSGVWMSEESKRNQVNTLILLLPIALQLQTEVWTMDIWSGLTEEEKTATATGETWHVQGIYHTLIAG